MEDKHLIERLVGQHKVRPTWKNRRTILFAWAILHLCYYGAAIMFASKLDLKSSMVFLALTLFSSALGWYFFTRYLNADENFKPHPLVQIGAIVGIIAVGYCYEHFFLNSIQYEQTMGFGPSEMSCLVHTVLAAALPVVAFFAVSRWFFISHPKWSIAFLSLHVTLMSVTWTEMSCGSREFWHLMLGHQAAIIGIFGFLILSYRLRQSRAS